MTTRIVRRLYLYIAALIGLQMTANGISDLATLLVERWFGGMVIGAADTTAARLGGSVALTAVGLALWVSHWLLAQRDAAQPEGQRSALRRLYFYALLFIALVTILTGMQTLLNQILEGQIAFELVRPLISTIVSSIIWAAHWQIVSSDRPMVEVAGANATLRRWYLALALWVSLAMLSFGAGVLMHALLQRFVFNTVGNIRQLALPTSVLISGLAVWLPHEIWSRRLIRVAGPLQTDELNSVLRQVFIAIVMASSLVAALTGLTALISAGMRAAFGVASWNAAFSAETRAVAAVIVALPLLFYYRTQLTLTAQLSGTGERMSMARRLVAYLVSAISLVALYFGLGGLLGTLLRLWLGSETIGSAWLTTLSWYAATTIVTLPVYIVASLQSETLASIDPEEERVLSRRIYLYASLLFGVIATVITATLFLRLLVVVTLGEGAADTTSDIARMIWYTILGGTICATYALLLQRAGKARGTTGAGRQIVIVAPEAFSQTLEAAVANELPGAKVVRFAEQDSPERRAALDSADLLMMSLATLGDATLANFRGQRLLLVTPLDGVILVGARQSGSALAREAARVARNLCTETTAATPPQSTPSTSTTPVV